MHFAPISTLFARPPHFATAKCERHEVKFAYVAVSIRSKGSVAPFGGAVSGRLEAKTHRLLSTSQAKMRAWSHQIAGRGKHSACVSKPVHCELLRSRFGGGEFGLMAFCCEKFGNRRGRSFAGYIKNDGEK